MQLFVVGGAVRDRLLGQAVNDRDWVAVGATPDELLALGYKPVGKDFPVFLHPQTGEEVALARTERKSGRGYHGFSFHAAPEVTLEQDLARRDLTINAMAESPDGALIDPFGGQRDLQAGVLRHVSPAFVEDPVRLLRLARFAARWPHFTVAPETQALLVQLVAQGEVNALVAERVWQELARGLMAARPSRMFEVLRGCGALPRLLPEPTLDTRALARLDRAAGSGGDGGADNAADTGADLPVRFALLGWPDEAAVARAAERLRVPAEVREVAELFAREADRIAALPRRLPRAAAVPLLALFERCDALRRPGRFAALLRACDIAFVDIDIEAKAPQLLPLLEAVRATDTAVAAEGAARSGARGPQVGEAVRAARRAALEAAVEAAAVADPAGSARR
ncbi:MAG: multifunctional CCA tRNA nucleotidyl transferase/2'3'-cyclic phosphodiesterase/2'nucleotidase/phosphatase [Burkholderiales bacterium]|nr:multifunctional CCA tRNA nucleotidyl transferase/2'3'-cyclic phosphodiesterase/2'nucleotidase/phosphatase [Burkholderiales bacterium]